VQEAVWTGEATNVDVDNFVRYHSDDITSTLNAAIAKHMYDHHHHHHIFVYYVVVTRSSSHRDKNYTKPKNGP